MTPSDLTTWPLLLAASLAGGAANALAGGGMFLVFPSLLLTGISPISANATATFTLLPGAYASTWVYRDKLIHGRTFQTMMVLLTLAGAWLGSELLLHTSEKRFSQLVPYLMIGACLVFTFAGKIRNMAASHAAHKTNYPAMLIGQFLIAIYGGYFGAGQGVMILALFLVASNMDVQTASGLRILCGAAANTAATIIFLMRGIIVFHYAIPMVVASVAGGYIGARLVQKMAAEKARRIILVFAWAISGWLFLRSLY